MSRLELLESPGGIRRKDFNSGEDEDDGLEFEWDEEIEPGL